MFVRRISLYDVYYVVIVLFMCLLSLLFLKQLFLNVVIFAYYG